MKERIIEAKRIKKAGIRFSLKTSITKKIMPPATKAIVMKIFRIFNGFVLRHILTILKIIQKKMSESEIIV